MRSNYCDPDRPTQTQARRFAFLVLLLTVGSVAACVRSISATPGTIDGRPAIEVCADLMAKANAAPSGAPRAVATVAPSAAPAIPRVE